MQPASASDWLHADEDAEGDTPSGFLTASARSAAVASALPILGRYFASGTQSLDTQPAVRSAASVPSDLDELVAGIRLRVALAAAARLCGILARILSRPTFQYRLSSVDSTGAVTGQLDVNRLILNAGQTSEVMTYPILVVQRGEHTPENLLAVYCALWLRRELAASMTASAAPQDGPEYREFRRIIRSLDETLGLPGLSSCVPRARELSRRRSERQLISDVKRRLRRREVANSTPYDDLVGWVENCLDGRPAAEAGDLDWSFYGPRFDTKLFELWCLNLLAAEVSRQLVVGPPPLQAGWRTGDAAYVWDRPAGKISLYFQRSLATISPKHQARWVRQDGAEVVPLRGTPDIVAIAMRREDNRERHAVIDPKLRQRSGPPADELYKVIGYFDNFRINDSPAGAVLYYTTSTVDLAVYQYAPADGSGGNLLALALNPADSDRSRASIVHAAEMLLGLLDIPRLSPSGGGQDETSDDPEVLAATRVAARVQELQALAATLPANVLDASRRRVRAILGDVRWNFITQDTQTMIATAEHVGFSLDPAADFSGPVIGICAGVEVLLHEHVIGPVARQDRAFARDCKTLGQAVHAIRQATNGGRDGPSRAIRSQLAAIGAAAAAVANIIRPLESMNKRYRVPAAHRDLVDEATWLNAWDAIMGSGKLLALTIDALHTGP